MLALTFEEAQSLRQQLCAPFTLDEHEIREGYSTEKRTRWFVYIRREAIQNRLDDLFPFEWSLSYGTEFASATFVSVPATLAIRGVGRTYNGGARTKTKEMTEDTVKAAYTDALKRVASLWGMGLYLQSSEDLFTANPGDNWQAKKDAEKQAFAQFERWYNANVAKRAVNGKPRQEYHPETEHNNWSDDDYKPVNGAGYDINAVWEAVKDAGFNDRKHVENTIRKMNLADSLTTEKVTALLVEYRKANPKQGPWYEDSDYVYSLIQVLQSDYGVTLEQVFKGSDKRLRDFKSGDALIEYVKQNVRQ